MKTTVHINLAGILFGTAALGYVAVKVVAPAIGSLIGKKPNKTNDDNIVVDAKIINEEAE